MIEAKRQLFCQAPDLGLAKDTVMRARDDMIVHSSTSQFGPGITNGLSRLKDSNPAWVNPGSVDDLGVLRSTRLRATRTQSVGYPLFEGSHPSPDFSLESSGLYTAVKEQNCDQLSALPVKSQTTNSVPSIGLEAWWSAG
jgi:hypothetical protein